MAFVAAAGTMNVAKEVQKHKTECTVWVKGCRATMDKEH